MKIKKVTLLLLTIITLLGCEDESSDNNVFTKHPMSIGTSWTYEKIWTINTYKSPTSDSIISSYTTKINGTIRIDKDTIINKKNCWFSEHKKLQIMIHQLHFNTFTWIKMD